MRQRNPLFNDWWAFQQLPNHLEFEALQPHDALFEDHRHDVDAVEDYWICRVELVTTLKEGAAKDTPRIMYARLARFARESGDAFTERQLVELYMGKQDKKIRDLAHPHMLLLYEVELL